MRIFLDMKVLDQGNGYPLVPISIGMVSETGRSYYAEFAGAVGWLDVYDLWPDHHKLFTLPHLSHRTGNWACGCTDDTWSGLAPGCPLKGNQDIANDIIMFVGEETPEFWSYDCAFVAVAFSQMFGPSEAFPESWSHTINDIKQRAEHQGFALDALDTPVVGTRRDALYSAYWNRAAYDALRGLEQDRAFQRLMTA